MTATATRYRVPSISVDSEVRIDEFAEEDIIKFMRYRGYKVSGGAFGDSVDAQANSGGGADGYGEISEFDLDRVSTLSLCGQLIAAREFALQLVSEAIGRPL